MNDYILKDIIFRLRNNFGIDTPLSNTSQRLQVIVSLLGVYDSNWCLESVANLIGQHVEVEFEHQPLTKEQSHSIKRWLQRLDLGYLIIPKKIEEFCANKKKYYHMLSVLMDKVEQHLGTAKLKSNITVIIQKQSRMKIQLTSRNLSKISVSNHSSCFDSSVIEEKSIEDVFQGGEIPRTPSKLFSASSPNHEENEKNKTFEIKHELSIIPISFVKDFDDLPYDNSNKRSSHYRRSSFDKNIIPTGRQIPNTPINQKSLPMLADTTFNLSDDLKDSSSCFNACKQRAVDLSKNLQVKSNKRRRSPSKDRITNYVLDEPESGTVWDSDSDKFTSSYNSNVKNIDWESAFHSSEILEKTLDNQSNIELKNNIKDVEKIDLNSLKIEEVVKETTKMKKPSRGRKKKVALLEKQVEDAKNDDKLLITANRTSRRRKCSVKSQDIISDNKKEINVEDLTFSLDTVSLDKLWIAKILASPRKKEKTIQNRDKENSDPSIGKSSSKNRDNDSRPQETAKNSYASVSEDRDDSKEVVLRRSTRNRKQNLKYVEDSILDELSLENNKECLTETQQNKSTRRNAKSSNIENRYYKNERSSSQWHSSKKKKNTSVKNSKMSLKASSSESTSQMEGKFLGKSMESINNDNIVSDKNITKRPENPFTNIKPLYGVKSDKKSAHHRGIGNSYFYEKDYSNSLLQYSLAVFIASFGSIDFTLALANRSAVFQKLSLFEESLVDIDFCLQCGSYPKEKVFKLYERQAEIYETMILRDAKIPDNIESNKKIRNITKPCEDTTNKGLEMQYEEGRGRYMVANRDIQPGETIILETPGSFSLHPKKFGTHCLNCFKISFLTMDDWGLRGFISLFILHCLKESGFLNDAHNTDGFNEEDFFVGSVILRLLNVCPSNCHDISEYITPIKDEFPVTCEKSSLGAGIYPLLAMFNHSCDPSFMRCNIENKVWCISSKTIKKGEEVFENYGMMYTMKEKEERQLILKKHYKFDCHCPACNENWSTTATMKQRISSYPTDRFDHLYCRQCFTVLIRENKRSSVINCLHCGTQNDINNLNLKELMELSKDCKNLFTKGKWTEGLSKFKNC
ncbi:unnamed protein product [Lepeophtheirus salmonis]|uniref:(salmon louse) hypothetical protein n=1 Tax=Lepeophtheirus salmonis TaxID=72036 RepID=A0A7R8D280_LEPSM|nr:unnamed protein product [Lepeophtheirus salmonis]CAF3002975.1 unnamed protein product [Lepeophtheirus salmonis]